MTDIRKIPSNELVKDYFDSQTDIGWCRWALAGGTTKLSDGSSIEARKRKNEAFMKVIVDELEKRGELARVLT